MSVLRFVIAFAIVQHSVQCRQNNANISRMFTENVSEHSSPSVYGSMLGGVHNHPCLRSSVHEVEGCRDASCPLSDDQPVTQVVKSPANLSARLKWLVKDFMMAFLGALTYILFCGVRRHSWRCPARARPTVVATNQETIQGQERLREATDAQITGAARVGGNAAGTVTKRVAPTRARSMLAAAFHEAKSSPAMFDLCCKHVVDTASGSVSANNSNSSSSSSTSSSSSRVNSPSQWSQILHGDEADSQLSFYQLSQQSVYRGAGSACLQKERCIEEDSEDASTEPGLSGPSVASSSDSESEP